jgi:AbrB family looped-hinge helix DNA binding protein
MVRARLSSKGQLTIPLEIRQRYGLDTGDEVEFIAEERGSYMVPLKRRNLMDLYGSIKVGGPSLGIAKEREIARKARASQLERKAKKAR